MKWKKEKLDSGEVREIAARYNVNLIVASILVRRGITAPEEVKYYLESSLVFLHNPFLFNDMEDAVDRINAAVEGGEKIKIFGDRDVDGITSTVILYETLKKMGADISYLLPEGENDYGLSNAIITELSKEGVNLLITVDCGVTSLNEIEAAAENGIDTVVVDHHNQQEVLPKAVAIINPKLNNSNYPFRELSGCGVVSKLIWALYFSHSSFYGSTLCLVNARPANDSYIVEAVKIHNLIKTGQLMENFVSGMVEFNKTRLYDFLGGYDILVLNADTQLNIFKKIFGEDFHIELNDIEPYVKEVFPNLAGRSLLRIKEERRLSVYSPETENEIVILRELFVSMVLRKEKTLFKEFPGYLDLIALGTLADLMPLVDENRILVKQGIEIINNTKRYWLKELIIRQNLTSRKLRTNDIAWQVSPVLNAAGRMGEPEKAASLMLTETREQAAVLVDEILTLNKKRKNLSTDAWNRVIKQARDSYDKTGGKFVLAFDPAIHRGVTGIVAARLSNNFHTPSAVLTRVSDRVVGSLRSRSGFSIKDFLNNFSDLLSNFGGHDFAAGFSMPSENYEYFIKRFYEKIDEMIVPELDDNEICIDAEIPKEYLKPPIKGVIDFFEPFGEKNPPLTFLTRGITLVSYELMGKKETIHVRLLFDTGTYKWPAVYWNGAENVGGISEGDSVEIIYRISTNYYQNIENTQLSILQINR